jgi:hypothetical protein
MKELKHTQGAVILDLTNATRNQSNKISLIQGHFLLLLIPKSIFHALINRFGIPILELLYSITKKRTIVKEQVALTSDQPIDPLADYKLGMLTLTLYYAGLITWKFYNGYRRNLTHLFEPYAPLRGASLTRSANILSQLLNSLPARWQELLSIQ